MSIRLRTLPFILGLGLAATLYAAPTAAQTSMSSSRALGLSSAAEAPVESPLLKAQRLYAQGSWHQAAEAYEQACSVLPKIEKVPCRHWSVLALIQTGVPEDFWKATSRLDTLLSLTEPENPYFAELLLTRSRLHLLQGNVAQASRTWKMSAAAASAALSVPVYQLCEDIAALDTSHVKECVRVKPKDAGLLGAPRVATVPNPAFRSSSSSAFMISSSSSSFAASSTSVATVAPGAAPTATAVASGWVLQLGAFSQKDNATLQQDNLKKQKIKSRVIEKAGKSRTLYIVQTEAFATKQEAQDYGTKVLKPLKLDYQVVNFQ
jgi:cell division septation protein DedD